MSTRHRRTLILLYARQVSAGLLIYQPIFYIFLVSRGITAAEFSLLLMFYNIGTLGLVVPAGRFADKVGRKWALTAANTIYTIGTLMIATGHSLAVFVLAEVLYSLAIALDAGVHSAFLFEFLRAQGREREYYRFDALGQFMFLFFNALGTLLGGYLAEIGLDIPIFVTALFTAIGIPCAYFLEEPRLDKTAEEKVEGLETRMAPPPKKNAWTETWDVARRMLSAPGLRWAVGLTVIWFWSRQFVNLYLPGPYFKFLGLELRTFGVFAALLTLAAGFIAFFSRRIIQRPDLKWISLVGLLLIPGCLATMGLIRSRVGLIGFFFFAIPVGLCTAVTNTLLNRQFSDHKNRATFLAIVDFCVRLTASAVTLYLGKILTDETRGIPVALVWAASFSAVIACLLLPGIFKFARDPQAQHAK